MRRSVLAIPLLSLWVITALADPQPPPGSATAQAAVSAGSSAATESVKKFLKTLLRPEEQKGARYLLSFQDLNGDGTPEAIAYVISRGWCGSGGCTSFILEPKGDSWTIVSQITITRPPIYVLSDVSNGWHSLGFWVQGGGIQPGYEAKLSFDGKSYLTNPSVLPAERLTGTPAGQEVIASMGDAKYLYDDGAAH
jgi:hypothetical protein